MDIVNLLVVGNRAMREAALFLAGWVENGARLSGIALLFTAACFAQTGTFGSVLYPALEKAGCRACHTVDGVASATRLHFPETDASPEKVETFGKSLVALVDRAHPENSLLLRKPT